MTVNLHLDTCAVAGADADVDVVQQLARLLSVVQAGVRVFC